LLGCAAHQAELGDDLALCFAVDLLASSSPVDVAKVQGADPATVAGSAVDRSLTVATPT
jgi:hypothetical protein